MCNICTDNDIFIIVRKTKKDKVNLVKVLSRFYVFRISSWHAVFCTCLLKCLTLFFSIIFKTIVKRNVYVSPLKQGQCNALKMQLKVFIFCKKKGKKENQR